MARKKRLQCREFETYMEEIVRHPIYGGLPIKRKRNGKLAWYAFANSKIGQGRKRWVENKAQELGCPIKSGMYAQVMLKIHPTKMHVCQICGSSMSILYHYPNTNLLKAIHLEFDILFTECDHIRDIWNQILGNGNSEDSLRLFFVKKFELTNTDGVDKNGIINMCESKCRLGGMKLLGPGAMSNYPDRFDGFHSYNRCCRAKQDTGRSRENLKSYKKDRRAYEHWSDGNLRAANMFMGSHFFKGQSADHIGPISLGFVHDPHYLRPMASGDNSTKRDRLLVEDIETILAVEKATDIYAMSWHSTKIWEFIKSNYKQHADIVAAHYRDMLKQNMANYMFILKTIIDDAGDSGRKFLIEAFIKPKYAGFLYAYEFDEFGNIVKETPRRITERGKNEMERFSRIALNSVDEYNEKGNRHLSPDLTSAEMAELSLLCKMINGGDIAACRKGLEQLVKKIEKRLIQTKAFPQTR